MTWNANFFNSAFLRSREARLATRNVRDFSDCEITAVDPWSEA